MIDWLCKVWALVVEARPDVIGAILGGLAGALVAAVGAIYGARLGGKWAMKAAKESAETAQKAELAREERTRVARVIALVQAIQAELEATQFSAATIIFPAIDKITTGAGLEIFFPRDDMKFPVYESSAAMLGDVDDRELRRAIVKTYFSASGLLGVMAYNNKLVTDYWDSQRQHNLNPGGVSAALDVKATQAALVSYAYGIVYAKQQFVLQLSAFWEASNSWLKLHGGAENPPPIVESRTDSSNCQPPVPAITQVPPIG